MPDITAGFADFLDPMFRWHFVDEYKDQPVVHTILFTKESIPNLKTVKDSSATGYGLVPQKTEAAATTNDERYQGYDTTYTQVSYGQQVEISREMVDFDISGKLKQVPRSMARSIKATYETICANVLNRHINGSYLGGDGKVLCANDHPAHPQDSTSHDNLGTAGSLTHTTLADGRLNLRKTKNERGIPVVYTPKYLVVPPDLEEKATIIIGDKYKSGSANYDVNILNQAGLTIVPWNYVTVTTAYWLVCDKSQNPLKLIESCPPEFGRDKDLSAQVAQWMSYFRLDVGFSGWRGIWGNNGA